MKATSNDNLVGIEKNDPIQRSENSKKTNFSIIDNSCLQNTTLSLEAIGLLSYLLSLPNDWIVYSSYFCKRYNIGIRKVRVIFSQLVAAGYMQRTRLRGEKGRLGGWDTRYSDTPEFLIQPSVNSRKKQPEPEIQAVVTEEKTNKQPLDENRHTENRDTENQELDTLYIQKKDITNNKKIYKKDSDIKKSFDSDECLNVGTWEGFPPTMGGNPSQEPCVSPESQNGLMVDSPEGHLPPVVKEQLQSTKGISYKVNNKKINKKSFDAEFEEFWEAYSNKVSRHKCFYIYNKILKVEGLQLHQSIIHSLSGQNKEREVNEALGIWQPLKKHPSTWLNGRCWEDSFKTEGEIHEGHRRSINKLANQPTRMSKTEQYYDINARVREAAARRVEAIEREREALEREIRNCENGN